MDQTRPGHKELSGKVKDACQALKANRYMVGAPEHLANDLAEIGVDSAAKLWDMLPDLLEELKVAGPRACYKGRRPKPEKSGEPQVKDLELWAFVWKSKILGMEVYLKFCLKKTKSGDMCYAHMRLHENR